MYSKRVRRKKEAMKIKHLSTRFILSYVGILALVFSILILAFEVGSRTVMDNYIKDESFSMQDELDASVTEMINESAYLYGRILMSSNVALLNVVADEDAPKEQREAAFDTVMSRAAINDEYFNDVVLFCGDTRFSANDTAFFGEDLSVLQDNSDSLVYVGNVGDSLVMGIKSHSWNSRMEGTFLFYMSESKISNMCNPSSGAEGYSFIMRSDGYIVSHPDKNLTGKVIVYSDVYNPAAAPEYKKQTLDGVRTIIVTGIPQKLNTTYAFDCSIVSVLDYKYYFGYMDLILTVVMGVSAALLVVAVIISIYRAKKISEPIKLLSDSINATVDIAGASKQSVLQDGDELKQLERNYDAMMKRIYDLMEKSKDDMQRQRKLELESLQMQINPHFLYNTLDAISWMAKIKKQYEIDKLVMNLASFFRLFLHNGDLFVTVTDEVNMVQSYLEIDKIRYPGRVTVHTDIAPNVANQKVLKLILQPIIENCVKHAFAARNGNIYIEAYEDGNDIVLKVKDDGAGFDVPEDFFMTPSDKGGYGLKNVNERIRLHYGADYGLSITSEKGKGTCVTARLKKFTD